MDSTQPQSVNALGVEGAFRVSQAAPDCFLIDNEKCFVKASTCKSWRLDPDIYVQVNRALLKYPTLLSESCCQLNSTDALYSIKVPWSLECYPLIDKSLITLPEEDPYKLFQSGLRAEREKQWTIAKDFYHHAMLWGHPDALTAEWKAQSELSKGFRNAYPEIFHQIQNGDRLRCLSLLRAIKDEYPVDANATLAYCLRTSNQFEEGIEACEASLAQDLCQSDVYGHLWSFYTQLGMDEKALETAKVRLSRYPLDAQAYTDALDSSLLLSRFDEAYLYAQAYLIHTTNFNSALKNLFKWSEATREWSRGRAYFEALLPETKVLTPETKRYYGETLIELDDFGSGLKVLEEVMSKAPNDAHSILAVGRALAKKGDLSAAVNLVSTVLNDSNRFDCLADTMLLITFLSQLLRASNYTQEALEVWSDLGVVFDSKLLREVGSQPFLEHACCLLEAGDVQDKLEYIVTILQDECSEDPVYQAILGRL